MRIQDFYYSLYAPMTGQGKSDTLERFLIRTIANWHLKKRFARQSALSECFAHDTIVSLTSFPARIDVAWLAIESIIRQQVRPERIILWLSVEQFECIDTLPIQLQRQQENGLEIRFVSGDIRSHKKYYYAYKEFPDKKIILIDDDIFYPSYFIKNLVDAYNATTAEKRVVCCYAMHIRYDESGHILPYNTWMKEKEYGSSEAEDLFFGSGGGIIAMAKDFHADLTNLNLALKLTPTADDIWLNAMAKLSLAKKIKIGKGLFLPIVTKVDTALYHVNVAEHKNDYQIENVMHYYQLRSL